MHYCYNWMWKRRETTGVLLTLTSRGAPTVDRDCFMPRPTCQMIVSDGWFRNGQSPHSNSYHTVLQTEREREMFYLTTHSTHFIYGYMASDTWLRTILIVRKESCCRHIGYSYRLTARVLLYAPSHRQDNSYHSLCYTSRGALAGTRNSSMGPPHEGSIQRPIAPWANVLPLSYVLLPPANRVPYSNYMLLTNVLILNHNLGWQSQPWQLNTLFSNI